MPNHSFKIGDLLRLEHFKKQIIVVAFYENGLYTNNPTDFISCVYSTNDVLTQLIVHYSVLTHDKKQLEKSPLDYL